MPPKRRKAAGGATPAKSRKRAEVEEPVADQPADDQQGKSTRLTWRKSAAQVQDPPERLDAVEGEEGAAAEKGRGKGKRGRTEAVVEEGRNVTVTEEAQAEEDVTQKVTKRIKRDEVFLPEGTTVSVTVETITVEAVPSISIPPKPALSTNKPVLEPPPQSAGAQQSAADKLVERIKKLRELQKLRGESQKATPEDVKAEFRKKQETPKETIRQERKRDKAATLLARETADLGGQDYERLRSMDYSIEDVERWEEKQREKGQNADKGFTDHAQVQARKYNNLVRSLKPNLDDYAGQKAAARVDAAGDNAFFPDANSLAYANPEHKTSRECVQRVVEDLKKQDAKRATFSRRREFNEDDDVTYINERNMHFNKKIARAYDKYTAEIKANFGRGTAL